MVFTQLLANSLIIGSIYALVAAGFSLIYATNKFMHFAHGIMVTVGGYLLFLLFTQLGIPFWISCIITLVVTGFLGWLSYRALYLPLQKRKSSTVILLIASTGLLIFMENIILLIFGADIKSIRYIGVTRGIDVLGAIVTPLQIVIFGITVVLLVLLYLFMHRTKLGRNMRAVSDNKPLASIIGINSRRIADISFIIGSVLAGIAGILIALEQNLTPTMGMGLIIKGFTGAIIEGIVSVPGAIAGSYILGIAENFGIWFLPSEYKDAISFVLLFIFLLFMPKGLFGKEGRA